MTDMYLKIGESVLRELFEYNKSAPMDDEAEFFPLLKTIINGVIATLDNLEEKENDKKYLIAFVRDEYIKIWVQYAKDDKDNPNINQETREAAKYFDNSYNL